MLLQGVSLCRNMHHADGIVLQAARHVHSATFWLSLLLTMHGALLQVKLEKQVTAVAARQLEVSAASIQKLLGVAAKFAAETFVPFEQGGRLAPDSITRFQQQLAQLEAAIEDTRCGRHL